MMSAQTLSAILRVDGGAKPGRATAGAVLSSTDGRTIAHAGAFLGDASNNIAESTALTIGLELALAHGVTDLRAFSDSELVIGQAFRGWRADGRLAKNAARSQAAARRFETFKYAHIPRELNAPADELCHAVDDCWYLPPGGAWEDGTATLGFVLSLEIEAEALRDMRHRNTLKSRLVDAIGARFPIALSRSVRRTNAATYTQPSGAGLVTYLARLSVSAHVASSPERRSRVEDTLLSIAQTLASAKARVARISG